VIVSYVGPEEAASTLPLPGSSNCCGKEQDSSSVSNSIAQFDHTCSSAAGHSQIRQFEGLLPGVERGEHLFILYKLSLLLVVGTQLVLVLARWRAGHQKEFEY